MKGEVNVSFSSFQFSNPVLISSHFEMKRMAKEDEAVNVHLARSINRDDESGNKATVNLTIRLNRADDEDACFFAELTMQSVFIWEKNLEEEMVEKLLKQNAISLLVSYARPIIAQLTSASPVPVYNLPFLNLTDMETEKD